MALDDLVDYDLVDDDTASELEIQFAPPLYNSSLWGSFWPSPPKMLLLVFVIGIGIGIVIVISAGSTLHSRTSKVR